LNRLAGHNRIYDRLDWWTLDFWRRSDCFVGLRLSTPANGRRGSKSQTAPGLKDELAAAALSVPLDMTSVHAVENTPDAAAGYAGLAWMRWCAVANGQPSSAVLPRLIDQLGEKLFRIGIREHWCVCDATGWLGMSIQAAKFDERDGLLSMVRPLAVAPARVTRPGVTIRTFEYGTGAGDMLRELAVLDASAFEVHWHYDAAMLARAFNQSKLLTVAVEGDRILGYQCAMFEGGEAHITRLAVDASTQHRGIGTLLLSDALNRLMDLGARQTTLNTPLSNIRAQALYRRFAFVPTGRQLSVFCKTLAA
jgi:ribosomal protein S18 acetylase RimI-like enzyme